MNQDYNNPAFKKLLQKLQEESWQLELLISGFAIFGLFTAYEPIQIARAEAEQVKQIYYFIFLILAEISCVILIFNLVLHVLLRALWIGALGLRYVSGDIDYEYLNYSKKFTKYLKIKVGSFDRYISQLENYCSIIFAISFLLIFYVISMTIIIITIALIGNYVISNDNIPEWLGRIVGIPLMIFLVIGSFLTLIDFATLGFLKKKRWLSKLYFPFYWIFSYLTLAFLYRPIVYNFLDNKFGKRLSLILFPLVIFLMIASSFEFKMSNYFDDVIASKEYISTNNHYEDLLEEKGEFIDNIAIQSKVITDPFIKIFIVFSQSIESRIFSNNPNLKPEKDIRGLHSNIDFSSDTNNRQNIDSIQKEYLKTFNSTYYISIDSTIHKSNFILGFNKRNELGFETYLPIDSLEEGKHVLQYYRYSKAESDSIKRVINTVPFWHFKNDKK